jgi:hypothetical protein
MQNAIDAVTDLQIVVERLDMDIGRSLFQRFSENLINKFDDRSLRIVQIEDVRLLLKVGGHFIFRPALKDRFKGLCPYSVPLAEGLHNLRPGRHRV